MNEVMRVTKNEKGKKKFCISSYLVILLVFQIILAPEDKHGLLM